jgi:hypothetical protein
MWLQSVLAPHSRDHHVTEAKLCRKPARAPMRRTIRRLAFDAPLQDASSHSWRQRRGQLTRVPVEQTRQTLCQEALTPAIDEAVRAVQLLADRFPSVPAVEQQNERENGGQYTHAAAWCVIAFAELGQGERAAEVFAMLNPINHSSTRAALRGYKTEPYVVAADVYSAPPHVGRGGWTWYTGAAGWLYRAGLESILGFQLRGQYLQLSPCIPAHWPHFEISFRHASARYEIAVLNPAGVSRGIGSISVDDVLLARGTTRILLQDDGLTHRVAVTLG